MRRKLLSRFLVGATAALLSCQSGFAEAADVVVSMEVAGADGGIQAIPDKKAVATVLLFLQVDCPISNRYSPEINRLVKQYEGKVRFVGVYWDDAVSAVDATKHGVEFGYRFPLVVDHDRKLQSAVGVSVTPEAVVLAQDGRMLYRGRIDNRYERVGVMRTEVTQHDLDDVLKDIVANRHPEPRFTVAPGCGIPPKANPAVNGAR